MTLLVVGLVLGFVLHRLLLVEMGQVYAGRWQRQSLAKRHYTSVQLADAHLRPRNDDEPVYCWRFNLRIAFTRWWFRRTLRNRAAQANGDFGGNAAGDEA